jgi:beta-glucosidase
MIEKYKNSKLSAGERAEDLLSRMTTREKVGQLNQRLYGFSVYKRNGEQISLTEELKEEVLRYNGLGVLYGLYRADPWSGKDYSTGLSGGLAPKTYNMIQKYVIEHSRFGIPMLLSSECPHGHQALGGYLLPVNLGTGASFNPELFKEAAAVCGMQLKEMGVDMALVSNLDILRDPRWGRSEECYGEDPYLAAELAKAVVTGIQEQGVAVVAKHFCAQGEGTGGVNASAARIGERELREIHLPAAEACCRVGVEGVMVAYNEIDGILCHANRRLLKDILREELGFQGVIMSDGVAIDQLDVLTGDRVKSGAMALKAGVDIGLWDTGFAKLEEALERGFISEKIINEAALRVLTMKFQRGLFENPYIKEDDSWTDYTYSKYPQALELARQSIVLLKNENDILPLSINKRQKIAVIGPNADSLYNQLGDYTPPVQQEDGITVLAGIEKYISNMKEEPEIFYHKGCNIFGDSTKLIDEAVSLSSDCDLTILVLGGSSSRFLGAEFDSNGAAIVGDSITMDCGEGVDSADLSLPGMQNELAEKILSLKKPVVSVLVQGRPYVISDIVNKSDSVLCAFYPGMMGGQAIAEVLFGQISPSGCLPVSIPRHSGQLPVYYNYKSSYAGMKYYNLENKPLFSFGYGLSYTSFQYNEIKLSQDYTELSVLKEKPIHLHYKITNTGDFDAFAVPQLYIRDLESSTVRRVSELKDFKKIWIPKGETLNCSLTLNWEKLSVWDENMNFTVEPGTFELYLHDSGKEVWTGACRVIK